MKRCLPRWPKIVNEWHIFKHQNLLLKCNKSPRLIAELHMLLAFTLKKKQLVDCLNYSHKHRKLSNSQCQGITELLEKRAGKDGRFMPNQRLIRSNNLSRVGAKIGSSRLARRVENVLHTCQRAFVSHRSIRRSNNEKKVIKNPDSMVTKRSPYRCSRVKHTLIVPDTVRCDSCPFSIQF